MGQAFMEERCKILVVDDDSTSLSTISAMLKRWGYDVVTAKRSVEALVTIRILKDIDLVVTELHMPGMNGLEMKKQIDEEFNLPVIVMSSDNRMSVKMKILESGVVFYLVKPVSPEDLKNVWQFVVTSKQGKKDSRRKASEKGKGKQEEEAVTAPRKARWVWTKSQNNRFFQAIRHFSPENAVPKKILEFMNVPGLTREHVASRLQRHRNSLKPGAEKGITTASKNVRSSFTSGQKSQTGLEPHNDNIGPSSFKGFSTSGWNTDYISGNENMETINNNPYSNYAGTFVAGQMNVSGNGLNGGYGLIMTNGTTDYVNVTAGFIDSEQENTLVMPLLSSQQQYGLVNNGQNDFIDSGLLNNANASVIGNTAQLEQFGEGIDFGNFLLDPSDYQFPFQQQGMEGALNPNSGIYQAQLNLPTHQSQNPGLSAAIVVGDNATNPWNEPTLQQLHETEEIMWPDLSSNAIPLSVYYPSFDQNPNLRKQGNQNNINSDLHGPYPHENSPSGNHASLSKELG